MGNVYKWYGLFTIILSTFLVLCNFKFMEKFFSRKHNTILDTFNFSGCLLPTHTTLMYGVFFIMPYNYTLMVGVAWNVDRRFEHFRSNASDVPRTFCKYLLRFTKRLPGIFSVIQLLLSLKTLNRSCLSVR